MAARVCVRDARHVNDRITFKANVLGTNGPHGGQCFRMDQGTKLLMSGHTWYREYRLMALFVDGCDDIESVEDVRETIMMGGGRVQD